MTLALREEAVPDSWLARWDTRWKLLACGLFSFSVLLQQQWPNVLVSFVLTVLLAVLGRVPLNVILGRLGLLALTAIPLLVIVPLTNSSHWLQATLTTLRIFSLGLIALTLFKTDSLARLLAAGRQLGVPRVLLILVQLAYRFTFVILAEMRRMRTALRTRGFRLVTNWHTYRTLSYAIGGVLVQSHDRAERVSEGMRCRGFTGEYHTLQQFQTHWRDVLGFAVLTIWSVGIVLVERLPLG